MIDAAAAWSLGDLLTAAEAGGIADRLVDGQTLTEALRVVPTGRRPVVRSLLATGEDARPELVAVLRAVEGARSTTTSVDTLWTMPGHLARGGPLMSSVVHTVEGARQSITCSTYNVQRSSGLWGALPQVARRPEITVRVYLDTRAADQHADSWSPTTSDVADHLYPGVVLRTREFDGALVRNHAKFLAVDHRFLLVTSANLSWSAEYGNVELGLFIDDPNLTSSVEQEMRRAEGSLYEQVEGPPKAASPHRDAGAATAEGR